tara:strand:+ start:2062 stop:2460 length:399 start_codon:yes stop_codon:yes gene_type:complete
MPEHSKNSLKARINSIYRNYLVLKYYKSGLLKNTPRTDENLKMLENSKNVMAVQMTPLIDKLSQVTGRTNKLIHYIDALKIVADLLNTEFFYEAQKTISDILKIYEENMSILLGALNISPIDQMKLSRIDFI